MIRIAYVINFIVKGGPSAVVLNMIHNLDRSRFEPVLITLFEGSSPEIIAKEKKHGVTVIECRHKSRMQFILHGLPEYKHILESNHIDIVHGHGFVPDVMNARLNNGTKTISTLHNIMFEDYAFNYGKIKGAIYCRIHLWALRHLSRSVCCSRSVYDVMKYKLKNATFIRNGIEPVQAHSVITRNELGLSKEAKVFLYAGVLSSRKNVRNLVGLFKKYHNGNEFLLILGKGEKLEECKQVADDHIQFLGFQTDMAAYMNISDVYVSASKSEGFSISVLEALSCGLGLFLSDIPSHHEVISMADTCYIGEVFTETSFQSQLDKLRKNYYQLKKEAIKNWQKENLSACYMTRQYMNLYEKVME